MNNVRILVWLSGLLVPVCLLLAGYCFIQIPFTKQSTEAALSQLERSVVENSKISPAQSKELDRIVATIRSNHHALQLTRLNLWWAGILGFMAMALANLLVFALALPLLKKIPPDTISTRDHSSS